MINAISTVEGASAADADHPENVIKLDDKVSNKKSNAVGEWYAKLIYQDFLQKVMLSDGTDPDNEPEW